MVGPPSDASDGNNLFFLNTPCTGLSSARTRCCSPVDFLDIERPSTGSTSVAFTTPSPLSWRSSSVWVSSSTRKNSWPTSATCWRGVILAGLRVSSCSACGFWSRTTASGNSQKKPGKVKATMCVIRKPPSVHTVSRPRVIAETRTTTRTDSKGTTAKGRSSTFLGLGNNRSTQSYIRMHEAVVGSAPNYPGTATNKLRRPRTTSVK